jgi:uncharacterized membrane protein YeaQ/YmgE (transglycosylase-associated protein family)
MSWLVSLVVGACIGWVANRIHPSDNKFGLFGDLFLGIVGMLFGSWLFSILGISLGSGILGTVITGIIGSLLFLIIWGFLKSKLFPVRERSVLNPNHSANPIDSNLDYEEEDIEDLHDQF